LDGVESKFEYSLVSQLMKIWRLLYGMDKSNEEPDYCVIIQNLEVLSPF